MSELQIFAILSGIVLMIILAPNLWVWLKATIRVRRQHAIEDR
jgi:hypothetical protein